MQKETANVILPGEREMLTHHLRERTHEGVRMNVNFLGEAILSEAEAERRLQQYLQGLQWPEIEVVSIKISTLYSQISPLAREHTVAVLCDRLERLIRTADRARFTRPDGAGGARSSSISTWRSTGTRNSRRRRSCARWIAPGLEHVRAGIALQSYIPDSFRTLLRLQAWARERVAGGGGRITIRLVKGANMESERVEASMRGWPQAPYKTKLETDANYKRMVHEVHEAGEPRRDGCGRRVAQPVRPGLRAGAGARTRRAGQGAVRDARGHGQRPAPRLVRACRATCCSTRRPARRRTSSTPSATSSAGWTRTPGRRTSCATPSRSRWAARSGKMLEQGFLASFDAIATTSDAPRRTQDRTSATGRSGGSGAWLAASRKRAGHRLRAAAKRRMGAEDHRQVEARCAATRRRRFRW